jgi:LacI family transcriptional regulator
LHACRKVTFNPVLIGYEAAVLLESLMSGGKVPASNQLIPPLGITVRQSSDILAIEDRHLADALSFIRQYTCTGITVADVLRNIPISRSSLERKTRDLLGRSPQAEIMRIKIAQVKSLLLVSDATLAVVARRSGFNSAQVLCERFRNEVGMTPGAYRKQVRCD